jgi:2,5-diketo-D-gluconate reductase A
MTVPTVRLNDGQHMPQIGLGTWPMKDDDAPAVIADAIAAGYRHIDTAHRYGNHRGVGAGIRQSGVARSELYVTTKMDFEFQGDDKAIAGLDLCLQQLGLEYVDMLLIHWPMPMRSQYVSTWRTYERLQQSGKVRSIGVSNFKPAHLDALLAQTSVVPACNQIQLSPRIGRADHVAYNQAHGIATVSWSPLGQGNDLLQDPVITQIAARHGKTPAQVVLRWNIERGLVAIPKSSNPQRLRENLDVFGFSLSAAEVAALTALDDGSAKRVDSDVDGH